MKELRRMFGKYVRPYRKYVAGSVALNMLSAVFNIFSFSLVIPILNILFRLDTRQYGFIPWDSAASFKEKALGNAYWFTGQFMEQHGATATLLALAAFMILMTLLKTACYFGSSAVMVPIRTGLVRDLRMQIYRKILSLPLGFFAGERRGDIIARMSGDVQEVENSITGSIDMLVKNPILIVIYMGTLFFLSWKLTLFVLVFAPLMTWLIGVTGRNLKRNSREAQSLWSDTMNQVEETLGGLRIIKAFLAERKMGERFSAVTDAMRRKTAGVYTRQALAHPVSEFLGTVMISTVLCFGGALILGGSTFMDAPAFIYYMIILYSVIQPIKDLSKAAYNLPRGMACMERIENILQADAGIEEEAGAPDADGLRDRISFEGVCFGYEGGGETLHDISFELRKGCKTALVGSSGGGKSTIAELLPRFYDPDSGAVTLDGRDIRTLSVRSLRSLIGYVNQDPILFNDTILANIAFGAENATMESVQDAAKTAGAHEFIMQKSEGYLTNVGDRGVKLSGGERQRISIARAILKNPPVLILDEATASLDSGSEQAVQQALQKLMNKRTTLVIAHRLSTVRDADEILVVEDGRIVERGTHWQLLEKGGRYKQLYDMQTP